MKINKMLQVESKMLILYKYFAKMTNFDHCEKY